METQIHSYAFSKRDACRVTLFGYATKSLPGLEINGLGRYGKTLKEKIIFLTRVRQLPVPLKRFVISTEYDLEQDPELLRWLDVPVLLLYWYLAGLVPMGRLDNCLAVGHISPAGVIVGRKIDRGLVAVAQAEELLLLGPVGPQEEEVLWIDARELLAHIPGLRFQATT
jgi:hypothetical protein